MKATTDKVDIDDTELLQAIQKNRGRAPKVDYPSAPST
jgi:hypothetical protein